VTDAADIALVVFDVDGVLTDGRLLFGPDGEVLKSFHVRDGHGIRMLIAAGADVNARSAYVAPANGRGFEGRTPSANRTETKSEEFASGSLTPSSTGGTDWCAPSSGPTCRCSASSA